MRPTFTLEEIVKLRTVAMSNSWRDIRFARFANFISTQLEAIKNGLPVEEASDHIIQKAIDNPNLQEIF